MKNKIVLVIVFLFPLLMNCSQNEPTPNSELSALEQAQLIEAELGPIPTFNCEEGVSIPIYVNGIEVFEDKPNGACDNPDLKGQCKVGSRIGRIQGTYENGAPRPEVVWVFFCRRDDNFAQMIGHNTTTGKTCFLELKDGYLPTNAYKQPKVNVPTPRDANYNDAWKSPKAIAIQGCNTCHSSDPFIHSRWVVGAKMANNPNKPVLPEIATPSSPYCIIGPDFNSWELKHISLQGNSCLSCHRLSNISTWNSANNTNWNLYMPPNNPGSQASDYQKIKDYISNNLPMNDAPSCR